MATKLQRAKGILDSLADGDVDNARINRVGTAFAIYSQLQNSTIDVAALTPTEKADIFLAAIRAYIKGVVRQAEVGKALFDKRVEIEPTTNVDLGV